MLETKTKIIGGTTFKVAPFMATEALRLKVALLKALGPALGQAIGALDGGKLPTSIAAASALKINGDALSHSIETLMCALSEDEFIALLKRVFRNTTALVDNGKGTQTQIPFSSEVFDASMDLAFAGKLFSIYALVLFVLEVNFPDFFTQMSSIGKKYLVTTISPPEGENGKGESS